MRKRGGVKLRIRKDIVFGTKTVIRRVVASTSSAAAPSVVESRAMAPGATEATPAVVIAANPTCEMLHQSPVSEMDKFLEDLSAPSMSNPKTAILAKVDSANALKYEGSMLYQDVKGKWVVDVLP